MKKFLLPICLLIIAQTASFAQDLAAYNKKFIALFDAGKFAEAIPFAIKAVEAAGIESGYNHVDYAASCENLGLVYFKTDDWHKSLPWFHEAVRAYVAATNSDQIVEVHLLYNLIGLDHQYVNNADSARAYFVEAYNYFLQYPEDQYVNLVAVGTNLWEISFTLNNLDDVITITNTLDSLVKTKDGANSDQYYKVVFAKAGAFRQKNMFAKAMQDYVGMEQLAKAVYGQESLEYASLLELEADCVRNLGNMARCKQLLVQSTALFNKLKHVDAFSMASHHNNLANYFGEVARFDDSFLHYDSAMVLLEKANETKVLLYGAILKSKAYTYMDAARYTEASQALHTADKWFVESFGKPHPFSAELKISQANTEYFTKQIAAAEIHTEEALALVKQSADTMSYIPGRCYELKALITHAKGNSQDAVALCRESIKINNRIFGDSNLFSANSLSNLGIIYKDMGEYALAEQVLQESFAIKWKIFDHQPHPQLALSLANWAMILIMQERYTDADRLLASAVEIMKANNMLATENGQAIINNVALLAQKQGDYSTAKSLYHKVMHRAGQDGESPASLYSIGASNLSVIMLETGQYDSAVYYGKIAMSGAEKVLGKKSMLYIKSANNTMAGMMRTGKMGEGRTLGMQLLPLISETIGDSSELMGQVLSNMASLELRDGNVQKAAVLQQQALDIQLLHFRQNLYALSERDQVSWWTANAYAFMLQPALLASMDNPDEKLVDKMINQQLQLKGFILHNAKGALQKIRNIPNSNLQKLLDNWQATRSLYLKELSVPVAERRFKTDSLEYIANTLQQAINKAAGKDLVQDNTSLTWKNVQQNLNDNEYAVEFIRYPGIAQNWYTDSLRYGAIIIGKKGFPVLVPLGREREIKWCFGGGDETRDVQVNKLYRTQIGKVNKAMFTGDSLYQLIWKPLMPYLVNAKVVHLAPEGILHKVAFAALPLKNDSVLLDLFEVRQYASVRQIDKLSNKPLDINSATVIGHADFNGGTKPVQEFWSDLPGTANEVEHIAAFLSDQGKKVHRLETSDASESNVKTANPSSDIVHIATHGFFLPERPKDLDLMQTAQGNEGYLSGFADPLLRSGIVLAGANKYWAGAKPENGDDGILTAYEIAQLDWEKTKLVALSACETGLGDVQDGEGVFGLKRALIFAGVQYTLVSLWQVPDKETAELMETFYSLLLKGDPVRTAFYKAQKAMRNQYKPYDWAAFVLSE